MLRTRVGLWDPVSAPCVRAGTWSYRRPCKGIRDLGSILRLVRRDHFSNVGPEMSLDVRLDLAYELRLGLRWGRGGSRGCIWCFDGRHSVWALLLPRWEAERIR